MRLLWTLRAKEKSAFVWSAIAARPSALGIVYQEKSSSTKGKIKE
ncbi:MAG: hypothetical protein NT061_10640 [Spirochaetes bacterium]|nr:hypothetical protein [Spirochaetota bacterium]